MIPLPVVIPTIALIFYFLGRYHGKLSATRELLALKKLPKMKKGGDHLWRRRSPQRRCLCL